MKKIVFRERINNKDTIDIEKIHSDFEKFYKILEDQRICPWENVDEILILNHDKNMLIAYHLLPIFKKIEKMWDEKENESLEEEEEVEEVEEEEDDESATEEEKKKRKEEKKRKEREKKRNDLIDKLETYLKNLKRRRQLTNSTQELSIKKYHDQFELSIFKTCKF